MDTIAAISTGNQITAIGILRLSGPEAFAAADTVFRPMDGKPLSATPGGPWSTGTCWTGRAGPSTRRWQ